METYVAVLVIGFLNPFIGCATVQAGLLWKTVQKNKGIRFVASIVGLILNSILVGIHLTTISRIDSQILLMVYILLASKEVINLYYFHLSSEKKVKLHNNFCKWLIKKADCLGIEMLKNWARKQAGEAKNH